MEHPVTRQIERTGHPIPIRNPEVFSIDPITCDCTAKAVMKINGKARCTECAEDEGVCLL